jgi:hypothetical protein
MLEMIFSYLLLSGSACSGTSQPILNGSYFNLTSYQGLYQLVNNSCGGLVGWGVAFIFFIVIFSAALFYSGELEVALIAGGGVLTILTLFLQLIGIVSSAMPITFGGIALIGIAIAVLRGLLSPFR